MPDVFTWPVQAHAHGDAVGLLRKDILAAHAASSFLPIEAIFWHLPVKSEQIQNAIDRGNIDLNGDNFENLAEEELWMEFDDPALEKFYITVPESFSGTVTTTGDVLEIKFSPQVSLEIPLLAELGVDRSAFQLLRSIVVSPYRALSILQDELDANKETYIDVELTPNGFVPIAAVSQAEGRATSMVGLLSTSDPCSGSPGGDPNDPDWYVVHRNDGICFVHYGTYIVGGQLNHEIIFGPAFKADCDQYVQRRCPDGVC